MLQSLCSIPLVIPASRLKNNTLTQPGQIAPEGEGTVYVVTNSVGPKFNDLKKTKFYHSVHFQNNKQMFAGITVSEHTLSYQSYQAYDVDGILQDEFVINRE